MSEQSAFKDQLERLRVGQQAAHIEQAAKELVYRTEHQRKAEELAARQRFIATKIKEKQARDNAFKGTSPSEVFEPEAQLVINDFLEHMKEREYPGSLKVTNGTRTKRSIFGFDGTVSPPKTRGYAIGFVPSARGGHRGDYRILVPIYGDNEVGTLVYLCSDGLLRADAKQWSALRYTGERRDDRRALDLPISTEGDLMPIITGTFGHSFAETRPAKSISGLDYEDTTVTVRIPAILQVPIEDLLPQLALKYAES